MTEEKSSFPLWSAQDRADIRELANILSYKRGEGTKSEEAFCQRVVQTLPGFEQDAYGNYWYVIPQQDGKPSEVLWSCHTDTVHHSESVFWNKETEKFHVIKQNVGITETGFMVLMDSKDSCLGADDGAGLWIMQEMIRNLVPGTYIFHRGEEAGCLGSKYIINNEKLKARLYKLKYAIAFDRKGRSDIITKQGGTMCCSDSFAMLLATQLPPGYVLDPSGVYTDTNTYKYVIPECTNLSVGYYMNHGCSERLDVRHVLDLRDAMIKFDETKLRVSRDPKVALNATFPGRYEMQYGAAKVAATGATAKAMSDPTRAPGYSWRDHYRQQALVEGIQETLSPLSNAAMQRNIKCVALIEGYVLENARDVANMLVTLGYDIGALDEDIQTLKAF